MVAKQVQRRRGSKSQIDAMVPALAEVVIDTSNNRQVIGDGITLGGAATVPNVFDLQTQEFSFSTAGGTANALTINLPVAPKSISQPLTIKFKASLSNTGSVTLHVNSIGSPVPIRKFVGNSLVDLRAGDFVVGNFYEVTHNGTVFVLTSSGASNNSYQVFTTNGTWTKPAGTFAFVEVWGGGGGGSTGGGVNNGGGGGGSYNSSWFRLSDLPSSVSVQIGNGGNPLSVGGTTSFGTYLYGYGGGGGSGQGGGGGGGTLSPAIDVGANFFRKGGHPDGGEPAVGGTNSTQSGSSGFGGGGGGVSSGNITSPGGNSHQGGGGGASGSATTYNGGNSFYGGGGGARSGAGGTSVRGGNGGTNGQAGGVPGGGGGTQASGGRGECRIWVF